ncbi:MAG TPA: transcription antitermination factor NusB [Frankiaceae bacterium]|nr:transcription antitermination factor NusB [Frankiaceae bacterium]
MSPSTPRHRSSGRRGGPDAPLSARAKARKRALDVLYETDLRGTDAIATLAERLAQSDPPVPEYTVDLVEGVTAHRAELDALISTSSQDWTIERMPPVDRNLLRIGGFELLYRDDVPDAVAINEAVELAARLSTDESATFINGVLARMLERRPGLSQ